MVIVGFAQDEGLTQLVLADSRRLVAGLDVEYFDINKGLNVLEKMIGVYAASERITLLIVNAENIPSSKVLELTESSIASFTYYRHKGDRLFKFLKNPIKPVSIDYRLPEFWFMLGSLYYREITLGKE